MTGSEKTILLVEDEPAQSLLTQHSLEQEGYSVIPVFSGEEAVETASAKAGQIDLVIMDIDLGSALDGIEAAKIILSSSDLPLLFLSSYTDPELVTRTESVSSYGYVVKGSLSVLLASVRMAFQLYEANQKLKHHEKLLKEREFWLNRSQHAASIGSYEINFHTGIWTCSLGLYKVFGVDESTPLDLNSWAAAIHPEDRELTVDYFNKIILEHGSFEHDYRIIRKSDGAVRWLHGIGETETGTDGNLIKMFGIIQDITEQKASMEAFSNTQQQMLKLIEASNDWIWEVDKKGVYTYSSPQVFKILGCHPEDVIGKTPFDFMAPNEAARVMKIFKAISDEMKPFWGLENVNIHRDGREIYIETNGIPKFTSNGEFTGYIGMDRDITERKTAEEKIKNSLKEKEILLSEIHHRVKNNLQVISSMLSLQADYISDAGTREHFRNSTNRIRTMALIHEKLYQSKDFSRIDIKEYLTDLTAFLLRSSVLLPGQISLNITGENFYMPLDNAIPCGLIVNELVSNSLKYAFTDKEEGTISINILLSGKTVTLTFSDTGRGLPADLDISKSETLGLQLVYSLVRQLNGKIELQNSNGLTFTLTFELK